MKNLWKRLSALTVVGALLATALVAGVAAPASATVGPCEAVPPTYEYEYTKTIPGEKEESHTEYRWNRSYSGPKEIQNWSYQNGSWSYTPGVWGAVPASLNPPAANSIAATGPVPGGTYGLPSDSNPNQPGNQQFNYRYQTPNGGVQWYPSETEYATQAAFQSAALTDIGYSGNGWQIVASIKVVTKEATNPTVVTDWFDSNPGSPWTATGNKREKTPGTPAQWQTGDPYGPCYNGPAVVDITATSDCGSVTVTALHQGVGGAGTVILVDFGWGAPTRGDFINPDTIITKGPRAGTPFGLFYQAPNGTSFSVVKGQQGSKTLLIPEDEGGGQVTVTYRIKAGAAQENHTLDKTIVVNTNCAPDTVVPQPPVIKDLCGVVNDHYGLPAETEGVVYSRDDRDILATLASDAFEWGEIPAGWVNENGVLRYAFNPEQFTDEPCTDEPEKESTYEWLLGNPECGDTTITNTGTRTDYTYTWNGETLTWDETKTEVPVEETRPLTPEEIADLPCEEPSLEAVTGVGTCVANAPYITVTGKLVDPDAQATDRNASITLLPSGVVIPLGEIEADGTFSFTTLWPGASVDANSVANGWPGWDFVSGEWIEVDYNFAETRGTTSAVVEVNPSVEVALSYPPATPLCDASPPDEDTPPLAETGGTIAWTAGVVGLGAALLGLYLFLRRREAAE